MKTFEKIETLVETRINGNSIKGNKTYENMLKSIKVKDLWGYTKQIDEGLYRETFYAKKLCIIEGIVKFYTKRDDI